LCIFRIIIEEVISMVNASRYVGGRCSGYDFSNFFDARFKNSVPITSFRPTFGYNAFHPPHVRGIFNFGKPEIKEVVA
jgi:hypothetical protein